MAIFKTEPPDKPCQVCQTAPAHKELLQDGYWHQYKDCQPCKKERISYRLRSEALDLFGNVIRQTQLGYDCGTREHKPLPTKEEILTHYVTVHFGYTDYLGK